MNKLGQHGPLTKLGHDIAIIVLSFVGSPYRREMIREVSKNDYNFAVLILIIALLSMMCLGALTMFLAVFV